MSTPNNNTDIAPFAAIINSRLGVQTHVAKAIAFAWLCGGIAIALCLTGIGCALALYGYSHMISITPAAERTAQALAQALEHADFRSTVSGTMSLAPNSE